MCSLCEQGWSEHNCFPLVQLRLRPPFSLWFGLEKQHKQAHPSGFVCGWQELMPALEKEGPVAALTSLRDAGTLGQ